MFGGGGLFFEAVVDGRPRQVDGKVSQRLRRVGRRRPYCRPWWRMDDQVARAFRRFRGCGVTQDGPVLPGLAARRRNGSSLSDRSARPGTAGHFCRGKGRLGFARGFRWLKGGAFDRRPAPGGGMEGPRRSVRPTSLEEFHPARLRSLCCWYRGAGWKFSRCSAEPLGGRRANS